MGRVGEIELGAIGIISIYYLLLFMIGFSYTKGTQILVARRIGEGELKGAGSIFDNSLYVLLALGIFLMGVVYLGAEPSLQMLLKEQAIIDASVLYIDIRAWGLLFSFTGSVFLAFYMAINRSMILLLGISIMTAANIFLNWLLIFGHWGFPEMGIEGAALASNLAEVFVAVLFLCHLFFSGWREKYNMLQPRLPNWAVIGSITKLALPIVLQTLIGLLAWFIFFTYLEKIGTKELAASNVVKQIYMFAGIIGWAFSSTANTVISSLMGQGKASHVPLALKRIVVLSLAMNAAVAAIMALFPVPILMIFTDDPALIEMGIPVLYVTLVALLVYSASVVMYYGIVSTGNTTITLIIEIVVILLYLGVIHLLFEADVSLPVFWTVEIFYWAALATGSYLYLRTGNWKDSTI